MYLILSNKFYDPTCQKPFEDRLKSHPYVSHFQHHQKSCHLIETNLYLSNDLLLNLIGNCAAAHFFEGNLAFDREWIFLSPSILKAAEKQAYNF